VASDLETHLLNCTSKTNVQAAKPTSALFPLRAATQVASITTTADKNARPEALMQKPGVIQGGPPPNVPTNVMGRKEVPLPSQEGKQGVLQYALFVLVLVLRLNKCRD